MDLAAYLRGDISHEEYIAQAMAEVGTRVLVAVQRTDKDGTYWTTIDRETKEGIGSFGLLHRFDTREEALVEAERFGSKWDWSTDREWIE